MTDHSCCRVGVEQHGEGEVARIDSPVVKEARCLSLSTQIEHGQQVKKRQSLSLDVQQTKHLSALWRGQQVSWLVNWLHYLVAC